MAHPLREAGWVYDQHIIRVEAPLIHIPEGSDQPAKKVILSARSTCREEIVYVLRQKMACAIQKLVPVRKDWGNSYRAVPNGRADLEDASLKQPESTCLSIHINHLGNVRNELRRPFIQVADAIVGQLCVLLNPNRYEGNWWDTLLEDDLDAKNGFLRWYGYDNTLLYHPALVSLVTGLLRQSALMVRAGVHEKILEIAPREQVRETLNIGDVDAAMSSILALRKWIEVPTPRHGRASNIPVPEGSFDKVINLHNAIFRHGMEATFKDSVAKSWGLEGTAGKHKGIHSFMGAKIQNKTGIRIAELAKEKAE